MFKQFLVRRWFLLALALAIFAGFAGASSLLPLANRTGLRYMVVATVLFLMALPLMVLYEISIIGARIFGKKKQAETEAEEDKKGADDSESEAT